jgi:hypothetical protein
MLAIHNSIRRPKDKNEKTNQLNHQGAFHARSLLPTITLAVCAIPFAMGLAGQLTHWFR